MNYIYKKNLLTIKFKIIMKSIYETLNNKKIGESGFIDVNGILYEFTKISEHKYLVQHSIYILDKYVELNGTMTTMEASLIYEKLLKIKQNK